MDIVPIKSQSILNMKVNCNTQTDNLFEELQDKIRYQDTELG
jgi:hypothetical protein